MPWSKDQISQHQKMQRIAARDIFCEEYEEGIKNIDWDRRERCKWSLREDLLTYHPEKFGLEMSSVHDDMIQLIEDTMLGKREQTAFAMPRGSGKTTLCRCGIEWALRHGHRKFPIFITADTSAFEKHIAGFKLTFETKEDAFQQDFFEICYPIRRLNRVAQAVKGQTMRGESTFMVWGRHEIVLPTTKETLEFGNAGGIIAGGGITSSVRGAQKTLPSGKIQRPDACLIDDPQTRESALSPKQCKDREMIVAADVKGMAGPEGDPVYSLMTCTVIAKDDMADRILSSERHPEWSSVRAAFIQKWPENMEMWHQYGEILRNCWIHDLPLEQANDFYRKNREEMDKGAEVYWEHRIDKPFVSALQTAMGLWIKDPVAFMAEYQNDPEDETESDECVYVSAEDIRSKLSSLERNDTPEDTVELAAFVDVQLDVLIYAVVAIDREFRRYVVDYGTFPDQRRSYWSKSQLSTKLSDHWSSPREGWVEGLRAICGDLSSRTFGGRKITVGGVDAAFGESTDSVFRFCRDFGGGLWTPCFGVGITASRNPITHGCDQKAWKKRHMDWGAHWLLKKDAQRQFKCYHFDSNFFKSQVHIGLATPESEEGSLQLFQGDHYLLADHLRSEYPILTTGRGRDVVEWNLRPGQDNDFFDCVSVCGMLGSAKKIVIPGMEGFSARESGRQSKSWSQKDFA